MLHTYTKAREITVAAALIAFGLLMFVGERIPAASHGASQARVLPITDPTNSPRLSFEDLVYDGAFRLPAGELEGGNFSFGGGPIAFNGDSGTLYVGSHGGRIAEVKVPTPVNSAEIGALPFAEMVQPFADPTAGQMKDLGEGANLAGLLVFQRRLYGTAVVYYDAQNSQEVSHFVRPLTLGRPGAGPMRRVWDKGRTGFVAGYMATVPPEWQSRLGGPAITGQCCLPIITRTSWGPAAFVWNPADLDDGAAAKATALLYYDASHPTLGQFEGSSPAFGGTTHVAGVALIDRSRTALFIGGTGTGPFCYGNGTGDKSLVNTVAADGAKYCFDPTSSDKGQHAYPYHYQMWAYDLAEWAQVRAGRKEPWEVKPYAVWPFELPTRERSMRIAGVAYDADRRRVFISQRQADEDGYSFRALIHVYRVR